MHASLISAHAKGDIFLYLIFLAGQILYILKRADMAVKSKTHPVKSKGEFIADNWVPLLIRVSFESIFFWVWRHVSFAVITGWLHLTAIIPDAAAAAYTSPWGAFALGFSADCLLDWASTSPKVPQVIRNWISEEIPIPPPVLPAQP